MRAESKLGYRVAPLCLDEIELLVKKMPNVNHILVVSNELALRAFQLFLYSNKIDGVIVDTTLFPDEWELVDSSGVEVHYAA